MNLNINAEGLAVLLNEQANKKSTAPSVMIHSDKKEQENVDWAIPDFAATPKITFGK